MDFFGIDYDTYDKGKIINGIDSALWVERYRDAGEFTITGEPTINFMQDLYVGRLITHTDTYEVMMVENIEIDESKDETSILTATGRSIEAILMENRTINPGLGPAEEPGWSQGMEIPPSDGADFTNQYTGIPISGIPVWEQIQYLIDRFCVNNEPDYTDEDIPNLEIQIDISRDDPYPMDRMIKINTLYDEIVPLLESFDGGIRIERPSAARSHDDKLWFVIHEGNDRRSEVQFDYIRGDVEKARYLISTKELRNKAYVRSKYYGQVVDPYFILTAAHFTGWSNRVKHVDFSDFSTYYTGADPDIIAGVIKLLYNKGWDEIVKTFSSMIMVDATISPTSQWRYRHNYQMGDIVYVSGNYGMQIPMRVIEYAESMDKDGEKGMPTLVHYDETFLS